MWLSADSYEMVYQYFSCAGGQTFNYDAIGNITTKSDVGSYSTRPPVQPARTACQRNRCGSSLADQNRASAHNAVGLLPLTSIPTLSLFSAGLDWIILQSKPNTVYLDLRSGE